MVTSEGTSGTTFVTAPAASTVPPPWAGPWGWQGPSAVRCGAAGPQGCDCPQVNQLPGGPTRSPQHCSTLPRGSGCGEVSQVSEGWGSRGASHGLGDGVEVTVALGHCGRPDPGAQGHVLTGLGAQQDQHPPGILALPSRSAPACGSPLRCQPHPRATTPGCWPSPGASPATASPAQVATVQLRLGRRGPPGSR